MDNNKSIKLVTISTDFEKALISSVKNVFNNIRHVGCLFHYIKILRLNLSKIGLFRNNIKDLTTKFLSKLGIIPFKFNDNPNIIDGIFSEYNTLYIKETDKNLFLKFKYYFLENWVEYIYNGPLIYIFLNKNQRSNSYLENYNRRIKEILGPFLSKRGRAIIPWPLFISFIRNEEEYYNKLIKDL